MFKFRLLYAFAALLVLTGCVAQLPWAPDERVAAAAYHHPGKRSIALITVASNNSNSMGHSALLINASQRVIYDPEGTWYHRDVPERADLLYGITPTMLQYYIDYHAREDFHVIVQTLEVSPEVAERVMQNAIATGASMSGMCANNTSKLLSQTPGLEGFPSGIWPKKAVEAFAKVPGVKTERIYQTDKGKDLKT